jgi:hypothetical protein
VGLEKELWLKVGVIVSQLQKGSGQWEGQSNLRIHVKECFMEFVLLE